MIIFPLKSVEFVSPRRVWGGRSAFCAPFSLFRTRSECPRGPYIPPCQRVPTGTTLRPRITCPCLAPCARGVCAGGSRRPFGAADCTNGRGMLAGCLGWPWSGWGAWAGLQRPPAHRPRPIGWCGGGGARDSGIKPRQPRAPLATRFPAHFRHGTQLMVPFDLPCLLKKAVVDSSVCQSNRRCTEEVNVATGSG